MRALRVVVAMGCAVAVPTAWVVGVAWYYDSVGELVDDMGAFLVVLTVIAGLPCAAYAAVMRERLLSVAVAVGLVFLDVVLHAVSAASHASGDAGGAGGALFWICLPAVALTYPLVMLGILLDWVSAAGRRRPAPLPGPPTRPPMGWS